MENYIGTITGNIVLGVFSQIPLFYGLMYMSGGIALFGPSPKPTTQELVTGWLICLAVLVTALSINILIYRQSYKTCKNPKILFVVGIMAFIAGVCSFIIRFYI